MAALSPVSRQDFVRRLRQLGFAGPFAGGRHEYLVKSQLRVRVPNPHEGDIGVDLLARVLRQAGITRDEWLSD